MRNTQKIYYFVFLTFWWEGKGFMTPKSPKTPINTFLETAPTACIGPGQGQIKGRFINKCKKH